MEAKEDIGYPGFLLMLAVFVGLALLSNFTKAADVQHITQSETTINSIETKNIQP